MVAALRKDEEWVGFNFPHLWLPAMLAQAPCLVNQTFSAEGARVVMEDRLPETLKAIGDSRIQVKDSCKSSSRHRVAFPSHRIRPQECSSRAIVHELL